MRVCVWLQRHDATKTSCYYCVAFNQTFIHKFYSVFDEWQCIALATEDEGLTSGRQYIAKRQTNSVK